MPTEVSAKALEQKLTLVCTLDMPTEARLLCSHRPRVQKEQFPPFLVHHFYCSDYRGSKNKSKTNNSETNQTKPTNIKNLQKEPHSCYTVHSEPCGHIVVLTMNKFIKNLNINTRMCKEHIPKSVLW